MPGIERFEDLVAWQKARALTVEIYRATRDTPFARDFGLVGQVQRAAVSIMSNLAEGFERGSNGEFHRFVCTAKGSCAELRIQLYIARDIGYLDSGEFDRLMAQAVEVSRLIGGLRAAIERKRNSAEY
jgi:four helix bundle protein